LGISQSILGASNILPKSDFHQSSCLAEKGADAIEGFHAGVSGLYFPSCSSQCSIPVKIFFNAEGSGAFKKGVINGPKGDFHSSSCLAEKGADAIGGFHTGFSGAGAAEGISNF